MAVILQFTARPIRRPVAIVASAQRETNRTLLAVLARILHAALHQERVPDCLREDVGLPPRREQAGVRRHPLDLTVIHAWRR